MLGLLPLLFLGLLVYVATLTLFTIVRLTRPPRRSYAWAVSRGLPGDPGELSTPRRFERFEFMSDTITFAAWSIDGDSPGGPIVILTHGWADSKVGALTRVDAVAPMASRVIAWDLRGHGESGGVSTLGLRERGDLTALIDTLEAGSSIVLFGWSLGAGVSLDVARGCERVVGVIAESPYRLPATPARNVLRSRLMPWRSNLPLALAWIGGRPSAWRGFDRRDVAREVRAALLVLHGERDAISPPSDGREIAEAGGGELVTLDAAHNDVWTGRDRDKAVEAVLRFVRGLGGVAGTTLITPARQVGGGQAVESVSGPGSC